MKHTNQTQPVAAAELDQRTRSAFSPRDVLYVLFRHKRKALLAFAGVFALTSAAATLLPDKYQSSAEMLVTLGRESGAIDPTATIGEFARPMQNRDSELNSEVNLLGSRGVAEAVARQVGPDRIIGRGTADDVRAVAEAADELQKDVATSVKTDSNNLTVAYSAKTPQLAQDVVDAYVDNFRRIRRDVYRNTSGTGFFADQQTTAEAELAAVRATLRTFKDSAGVSDVSVQRTNLLGRIGELEAASDAAHAERAGALATAERLEARIENMPRQVISASTTGAPNSSIETLRTRLSELRLEEQDLSTRYVETSPVVRNARAQITEAERLLAEAEVAAETTTSVNPVREQLSIRIETERATADAQAARLERLTTDLDAARSGLARLNKAEVTIGDLEREAAILEKNVITYAEAYDDARINTELDQANISNIRVTEPANLPVKPSGPNRLLLFAAGLFMATLAGGGAAFAADALDHTVARPDDLLRLSGKSAAAAEACVSIPRLRSGQAVAKGAADYFDDLVHSIGTVFGTAGRRGTDVAAGTRRQARGFFAAARYISWSVIREVVTGVPRALVWLGNGVVNVVTMPFNRKPAPITRTVAATPAISFAGAGSDGSIGLDDDPALGLNDIELQDEDPDARIEDEPLAAPPRRVGRSVRLVVWAVVRDAKAWWHRDEMPNLQLSGRHNRTAASAAVWRNARGLVEQLILAAERSGRGGRVPPTVCVVAARPNSGTTTVAAHLAGVLAERVLEDGERRDGDVADKKPALLMQLLDSTDNAEPTFVDAKGDECLPNVSRTPAAGLDRTTIPSLRTADVRNAIAIARRHYRHVVVDVPPVYGQFDGEGRTFASSAVEEAGPRLAALCETSVLVMHADRLRREAAARAIDRVTRAGATIDVVVLNKRRYPVPSWLYRRI